MKRLLGACALVLGLVAGAVPAGAEAAGPAPAVVAVTGESALNPAHLEFRDAGGSMPALPPHTVIALPDHTASTDFADLAAAMDAGPLGRLQPGELYRIAGTRLLVYVPMGRAAPYSLIRGPFAGDADAMRHGTGATGAAIGATHGTAPTAWAVFVPTTDPSGYEWVAAQDWIDVATVSSYELSPVNDGVVLPCPAAAHVRAFARDRVFFASSGNSEHSSHVLVNSEPAFYLVGGVDSDGDAVMDPRVPAEPTTEEIAFSAPYATRTYETGDRYEFRAADYTSIDGTQRFGGTSGASPSTAGRAAVVITAAREILGDTGARPAEVLAASAGVAPLPAAGPLADGVFTAAELTELLHAVAVPKLTGPARYLVEGYGGLSTAATEHAVGILRGDQPLPSRPDDDRAHEQSEAVRGRMFAARGCG